MPKLGLWGARILNTYCSRYGEMDRIRIPKRGILHSEITAVPGENGGGGQAMAMPWEFPAEARQTHLVNSTSRFESKTFTGRSMYSALSFEVSREWMLRCSLIRAAMKGSRRT